MLFSGSIVLLLGVIFIENAVQTKVGHNKCRIGVIFYAKVNFSAFLGEILHTHEGHIATKAGRWFF
jgi:hypothetical protein